MFMSACGDRRRCSGRVPMDSQRLTLRTAPAERLVLDMWDMPSLDGLDSREKKHFHILEEAIRTYVTGNGISKFLREHAIHSETFYRAFDKCLTLNAGGKPFGWVGLLPYLEVRPRKRRAALESVNGGGGLSGALDLFLRLNTEICDALISYLDENAKRKPSGEAGIRHKSAHIEFLKLCEAHDVDRQRWPFTSQRLAAGAIRAFVNQYLINNYDKIVATQYGNKAATKAKAGNGHESRLVACMPFDVVELDEHTAGFIGTVRIETPEGPRYIDAGRVTILLMADRFKGWIVAFKAIFRQAASSDDVLDVIHAGMVGEPGYAHHKRGDASHRPLVDLNPHFGWCGFNNLLIDNALIHLAEDVVTRTMELTGCAINFGPVRTPARRQLVERIFNGLERAGFKRLQTTTGAGPQDPKKQDPESKARACMMSEREIVELISKLVRQHNTSIGKHNLGASPQQRMAAIIAGEEQGSYLFPFLPPLQPGEADLSKLIVRVPVRGNKSTGRRPYFGFLEADYTSTELAATFDLLNETIVLHVNRANIRKIPAFHNGKPLGLCQACGRWRWSDHSLDLRRYINKLLREGYIDNEYKGDIVVEFVRLAGEKFASSKAERKEARSMARNLGDQSVRRKEADSADLHAETQGAEEAVNELLSRASEAAERESTGYMPWDDIGAFNGDEHGD